MAKIPPVPSVRHMKPTLPPKPNSFVPPPKPCGKPSNDDDDDSDEEDQYGYIQPESELGDLANLIREAGQLPICVKLLSTPQTGDTACKGGDVLMIHCTDKEQVVKATEPTGKTFYLPVHSHQLYQMLPIDPRLDGKEYRGTLDLVKANPLPQMVRVLVGYCDETNEDDTKEQDDIITIEGVEKGRNDELYLTGKIMGEEQLFRAMEDEAVYTTRIISETLPMSKVVQHKLPVRVRTVSKESPLRWRQKELVYKLECLIKRERIIATRASDGAVFAFPFSTPLKLDRITPPWSAIASMMKPLYSLVNTSMCMRGLSEVTLPRKAMKAVPQPKKEVLNEWLESPEAKIRINDLAEQDNLAMQKKMASLVEELKRAESELKIYKSRPEPRVVPARPPRSPQDLGHPNSPPYQHPESLAGHPPQSPSGHLPGSPLLALGLQKSPGLEPPVPSRPGGNASKSSHDEEFSVYDEVNLQLPSSRTSISLASTDLEKELKSLLGEKILEIQTKGKEYRSLKEQYKILELKFNKQAKKLSAMEQQLETLSDEEACYDVMTPDLLNTPKTSSGKEHHILPLGKLPSTDTSLKKTFTVPARHKPPNIPLPSVPISQEIPTKGTMSKPPRDEYDPLPIPTLVRDNISLRPPMKSPTKKKVNVRFPLPTEPVQPHSSMENSLSLSRQTDSFKRSMTASFQSSTFSEYDLPDTAPPLPPLPHPVHRNPPVTPSSNFSHYDLPDTEPSLPSAHSRAARSPVVPLSPNASFNPVMYSTPNTNLNTFTKENVAVLLRSLNLDDCVNRFLEESVDGILLMSIDEEMMIKELGMTSFQARKLTIKIDELTSR